MRVQVTCIQCGTTRAVFPSRAKTYRFCNRACLGAHALDTWRDRYWSHVDKSGECWLWTDALNRPGGYGVFRSSGRGPSISAHRVSWELHFGPIPKGQCVLHGCDVNYPTGDTTSRRCVRPNHLHLGTRGENCHEMAIKGRAHHTKGRRAA